MNELLLVPGAEFTGFEPIIFLGLFGFLKKIKNTIKKVGGLALNFVPGGGIIKTGLGVATQGIGAIIRSAKGSGAAPTTGGGIGQPTFTTPQTFTQPTTGSAAFNFPQPGLIFGMQKTTALAVGGVVLAAAVFFMTKKR